MIVVVVVVPSAVAKEVDFTVTGGGVMVVVAVEVTGEEIVLSNVQLSKSSYSDDTGGLPLE